MTRLSLSANSSLIVRGGVGRISMFFFYSVQAAEIFARPNFPFTCLIQDGGQESMENHEVLPKCRSEARQPNGAAQSTAHGSVHRFLLFTVEIVLAEPRQLTGALFK